MNIENLLKEIFDKRPVKRKNSINDLKKIYKFLGNPCNSSKIIHIAGTNGKGSTSTFLENILYESDKTVGKFTSPHILKYNERISFNKNYISNEDIIRIYKTLFSIKNIKIKNIIESLNFFEITFFISLLYFEEQKPEFIILETGLGGRLDATNCINSDIAVITNVSFDHISILGNSLQEIAFEKCGIIKNEELCVFSQSLDILEKEISKKTSNYINVLTYFKNINISLDKKNIKTNISFFDPLENKNKSFILPLFGNFQGNNFLLSYYIAKIYNINDTVIQKGINNMNLTGRFEVINKNPLIIVDVAHNQDSMMKLKENILSIKSKDEVITITSILSTKDIYKIINEIKLFSSKIFITSLEDIVHGLTADEIKVSLENNKVDTNNIYFINDINLAYQNALEITKNYEQNTIIVCGSFFEISKFYNIIEK